MQWVAGISNSNNKYHTFSKAEDGEKSWQNEMMNYMSQHLSINV